MSLLVDHDLVDFMAGVSSTTTKLYWTNLVILISSKITQYLAGLV